MATNYTGNPTGTQAPSAQPGPGVIPVKSIPAGTDPLSIESITQDMKVDADFIAWLMQNTAGVIPTLRGWSGPTLAGILPQLGFQDSAGNLRSLIDHNGYPMGRRFELREDWQYNTGTIAATAAPIATAPRWSASIATGSIVPQSPVATYPAPFVELLSGAPAGAAVRASLYSADTIVHTGFTGLAMVIEWEAGSTVVSDTTHVCQHFMGLSDVVGPPVVNSGNYILFRYLADGGHVNWLADTCSAGTATSVDTGVLASANTVPNQRFRIEIYGSATPFGSKVRFFINEALVATTTTNIPAAAMYLTFAATAAASGTQMVLYVGGLQAVFNRALSVANL